ncbi:hypothetical protein N7466_001877 [Penicillium verhagenii]|uniref:uncharacterized protein n=1 Tax=Penicillium verhagenii TaxID=1562060 RepID=UPI0025459F74|nr:uncharacterized protein N7466_001877 [Penicillium verhagenii]KAJ5938743.1 hypothetical protein N7466_001877 [Penicillium verhagenii]
MTQPPPQAKSLWARSLYWTISVLAFSIFYRAYVHNVLFVTLGLGRQVQPLEDFPWKCTRQYDPLLQGCEDMWLDHNDRKLYAACSTIESRQGWTPGGNKYDLSARSLSDHIAVLDIDNVDPESGLSVPRQLKIGGYEGALDLHGFDVRHIGSTVRFWLINHKPAVDAATGQPLDAWTHGANSTVEIFDLNKITDTLEHVRTVYSDAIISPNNLAVDADGVGFVITNDHKGKTGRFRDLEMLYGTGSLTYCRSDTGECNVAAKSGFRMPNGIAKGRDGLYYVAHSVTGHVTVHKLEGDQLKQVDTIQMGYPVDNISFDEDGSLIAAAIPDSFQFMKSADHPHDIDAPATVLATPIKGKDGEWKVLKIVEDALAIKLPSSTVAVQDTRTSRLFLGGVFAPFITVCEKQEPVSPDEHSR